MSTRRRQLNVSHAAVTVVTLVGLGLTAWQPETGGSVSLMVLACIAALGGTTAVHCQGETRRPSGTGLDP
jgi:Na+/proline symporter